MNQPNNNKDIFTYHLEESMFDAYLSAVFDSKKLVLGIMLVVSLIGCVIVMKHHTLYEASILIQVEENPNSSQNLLGEISSMFDVKPAATAEIEIIRSHMVMEKAVDLLKLDLTVSPKYFPFIGFWISRHNDGLSTPGLFGRGGYVWGQESAVVSDFKVPNQLLGHLFLIVAQGKGHYKLIEKARGIELDGKVGELLQAKVFGEDLVLMVSSLNANAGAHFTLIKNSKLNTLNFYQNALEIVEKGKQSGIISVKLKGANPYLTSKILNVVGDEYVRQNVERKLEEAKRSLIFLQEQLPNFKAQMDDAEAKLNDFRDKHGTIDLLEESRLLLKQSIDIHSTINDLKQNRQDLLVRFTPKHPSVLGFDEMIKNRVAEVKIIDEKIEQLPYLNQELVKLNRDVKVSSDLYITLLKNEEQLRLVEAGKMGNVRLVDEALVPDHPLNNKPTVILIFATAFGFMLGIAAAIARKILFGHTITASEIEQELELNVYAAIPFSDHQLALDEQELDYDINKKVLAIEQPFDVAIDRMRTFISAISYGLKESKTKVILLTGATPGLGKSFISTNLAVLLAETGKKVVLVDADLRRGILNQYFAIDSTVGLSDLIESKEGYDKYIHKNILNNLDVVCSGTNNTSPTEVLMHENCNRFFSWLPQQYDYVVIDTPAMLEFSDAMLLLPYIDAVFLLARVGDTKISDLRELDKRCRLAGKSVDGVVMNGLRPIGAKLLKSKKPTAEMIEL
jgi:tyrosine-protein kinase Etk/Wzc